MMIDIISCYILMLVQVALTLDSRLQMYKKAKASALIISQSFLMNLDEIWCAAEICSSDE